MGVLGLIPFLQKTCPEVIKELPDRLRAFAGKTIVIDGTLVTQRFHFVALNHPHRHVLGWYRLIKEFQECNVKAICVFDGKERSLAKAGEVERRREVQRQTIARNSVEEERLKRLRTLVAMSDNLRRLDNTERSKIAIILRKILTPALTENDEENLQKLEDVVLPLTPLSEPSGNDVDSVGASAELILYHYKYPPTIENSSRSREPAPISPLPAERSGSQRLHESGAPTEVEEIALQKAEHLPSWMTELSLADAEPSTPPSKDVSAELISLYLDYQHSIPRLRSLSPPDPLNVLDPEERTEYAMTKSQYQLMVEEGQVWDKLGQADAASDMDSIRSSVFSLAERSRMICESYRRRTNPPTTQTYNDSKEILRALGVPCLVSSGPFEAEALASALVMSGHADYVASEDTDVLVYEAPLIRNVTNRLGPLTLISGSEIRKILQLDRAGYIDFALLLGTDFSPRIKNVGPNRALKFIRHYGSIERVIEHETKYPPRVSPDAYLEQVQSARHVFETLPPLPELEHFEPTEIDETLIMETLLRCGLQRAAVDDWDFGAALAGNYFEDDPAAY